MKKIVLLVVLYTFCIVAQVNYTWRSEATNGNWNEANNWWRLTTPTGTETPGGAEILLFDNNVQTTMTNNLSAALNRFRIIFQSNSTNARTISGSTENTFYDYYINPIHYKPKIENNSTATHTINFPIKFGYPMEINPISGDLTISSDINILGNSLDIFGSNVLTLSGKISGQSTSVITVKESGGTLNISGSDNFVGDIFVEAGGILNVSVDFSVRNITLSSGATLYVTGGKTLVYNGTLTNNGGTVNGNLVSAHGITIDGDPADWTGTASVISHQVTYDDGELIYTGVSSDERTGYNGTQLSSNNDITEVRFGTDGVWLYMMFKMRDITNIDYPHICLVFSNGSSNRTFIGDDSKKNATNGGTSTSLGNSVQNGRLVDIHATSSGNLTIEMYDGGSWYAPPTGGGSATAFSLSNNVIEAKIALADLGLEGNSISNVSLMTTPNFIGWCNVVDATIWNVEDETNGVDVMTPGASSGNASTRDLSDGDVDYYAELDLSKAPMPVELTSFSAKQNGSNITLNWKTATEVNNYGFEVQKSSDNSSWNKIGFVQGAGNSNSPKEYSYTDKLSNLNGKFYYRLKQMDNDGTISFSKVVEVLNSKPSTLNLSQNYPNPFNPSTVIKYQIPVDARVSIKVYNVLGNVVATLQNGFQTAGEYSVRVDGSNLASGVYFYKIEAGDFSATKKMLLTK